MDTMKIAAIALAVAGILGLVYGGFSYTRESEQARIGPLELTVSNTETVNVPVWAGVGAIALGGVLLVMSSRRR